MMVWFPQLSIYKGALPLVELCRVVTYDMMSFHGGYNEWHILLHCGVAQYDWYHAKLCIWNRWNAYE